MNIYLIGYRATGKTVVGRRLAEKMGRRFIDADEYLESTAKMTVAEIVGRYGWRDFRQREEDVITRITEMAGLVAATGGGVVLTPGNVKKLKNTGRVIWLYAAIDTILSRMAQDNQTKTLRPSLLVQPASLRDEVQQTLAERIPLYEQASHIRIDTDGASIEDICSQVLRYLEKTSQMP